tara:strand:+ start:60 stop:959 length:900 start_codon:yes stop_codon:yes gene_type:complete
MSLRMGIIGLSEGNGHPYSWSAIFNGYDPVVMKDCGFPVIPEYLGERNFPEDAIGDAKVTHIWTDEMSVSEHVAKASKIPFVVKKLEDMVGVVDAVLLARDDAENHRAHAEPFLKAGMPIYIDKPLSLSITGAKELLSMQRYDGQIFTCSALKYAREFQLDSEQLSSLGKILYVRGDVPKDWDKYAIHIIDPILQLPIDKGSIRWSEKDRSGSADNLTVCYSNDIIVSITAHGNVAAPIKISLFGSKAKIDLLFADTFSAFKSALQDFVDIVNGRGKNSAADSTLSCVNLIELGRFSDE